MKMRVNEDIHIKEFYDADAIFYDRRWNKPGGYITYKNQRSIVSELAKNWVDKRVIEIGCGTGRFTNLIKEISSKVTIAELSKEMLKITKERVFSNDIFLGSNASVYGLPFDDNVFDGAISINVFNHLQHVNIALSEIKRVLKPTGELIINFANLHSYFFPGAYLVNRENSSLNGSVYSAWYSLSQINKYLKVSGFNILQIIGNVYIPFYLDYPGMRHVLYALDKISRKSKLKVFAPSLFYLCNLNPR